MWASLPSSPTPILALYVTQVIQKCILLVNNSNNTEDESCFWPRWRKETGFSLPLLTSKSTDRIYDPMVCRHWTRQHRTGILRKGKPMRCPAVAEHTAWMDFPGHCAGKGKPQSPLVAETVGYLGRPRLGRILTSELWKEERGTQNRVAKKGGRSRERARDIPTVPTTLQLETGEDVCVRNLPKAGERTPTRNKQNLTPRAHRGQK